ncbi:unnamed protein product [Lupinus luteus]|uniref:Ty3 transposon capsid-like protein domain-containing protein n=1 Tax=Lupinus luteus TaxID=3873 RepID=A0AAV1WP12_LUPLU
MQATVLAMEGKAIRWFQWWEKCNPNPSWEGFKVAVIRRFQPSMIQNPFELLLSLKQEGIVEEYVEDFEKYVGALRTINPDFTKGIFLKELKEELWAEIRLYELKTLAEVMQKAILIGENHDDYNGGTIANATREVDAHNSVENEIHDDVNRVDVTSVAEVLGDEKGVVTVLKGVEDENKSHGEFESVAIENGLVGESDVAVVVDVVSTRDVKECADEGDPVSSGEKVQNLEVVQDF